MYLHDTLFIGGEWVVPATAGTIDVISPHTEEVLGRVPDGTPADMDRAVAAARAAFDHGPWPRLTFAERAEVLGRLAALYAPELGEMAALVSAEAGTPISFAQLTAPQPLAMLQFFAEYGKALEQEDERRGMFGKTLVRREPVGVVAAVVPWALPQFTIMSKLAPALLAGCTIVLKPAPESPLDVYPLAELVREAGIPPGVVNIVPAGRSAGEYLVTHPDVDKVAFTGSTTAGRRVAGICGERLKRVSLELGGKSAAIILDDVDLTSSMSMLSIATLMNSGQSCLAQTRVLASRGRYYEVVEALADMMTGMQVGDPADPATGIGPMIAKREQKRVEGYIRLGAHEGAKAVVGGLDRPHARGWYVAPTLFADVGNDMRIAREEIFGPVLSVIPYDDEAEAIRLANDSEYGLAGSVWTADLDHGTEVARQVRTGTFGVNCLMLDANVPFGGFKASGVGRELGPEGLAGYQEYKTIMHLGG